MDKPITLFNVIKTIKAGSSGVHLFLDEYDGEKLIKQEASDISNTKAQMEQSHIVIAPQSLEKHRHNRSINKRRRI